VEQNGFHRGNGCNRALWGVSSLGKKPMEKKLTIKLYGLVLLLLLAASVKQAWAQSVNLITNPDSALAVALARFEGTFITLDETQRLALQNAASVQEAAAGLRAARGMHRNRPGTFCRSAKISHSPTHLFPLFRRFDFEKRGSDRLGRAGVEASHWHFA
jgi:hypothetical protein